ncbi:MAG: PAS domain S-box protein [Gammaproteobacteria bacterium]
MIPERQSALAISLLYALFAGLWIVVSDAFTAFVVGDEPRQFIFNLGKGLAFVAVTSAILYLLLRNWRRPADDDAGAAALERPRPALRQLLPLLCALTLAVPLTGFAVYVLAGRQVQMDAFANLEAIAALKIHDLDTWMTERHADAGTLSRDANFIDGVQALQRRAENRDAALIRTRLASMQRALGYRTVGLLNADHEPLLTVGDPDLTLPRATRVLLRQAVLSGEVRRGKLQQGQDGRPHLDFIAPLVQAGSPVGAVVLRVDPARFLYPLLQSWPTPSPSGEILLARVTGDAVTFLNAPRHRPDAALSRQRLHGDDRVVAVLALSNGGDGTLSGTDYRGIPVLAAHQPVPGTNWQLITKLDRAEALAPARRMGWWAALVALGAALPLGVAVWLLLHQQRHAQQLQGRLTANRMLEQFFRLPFVGMAVMSPQTRQWLRCNDRLCEMLGCSPEVMTTLTCSDMTHPDDRGKLAAAFERVLGGAQDGFQIDQRFVRKDDAVVEALIDVKCTRRDDGQVDYFIATIQDITAEHQAQLALQRSNRMYATLSRCSAAIAYSGSRHVLYDAVCSAAIEAGDLRMAWIGEIEAASGRIIPVACYGAGTEYLDDLHVTHHADDPAGHGPSGTAVRANEPVWCQDFQHDPRTAPWRERGAAAGWGSSAALPLRRGSAVVGVLNLYAGERDAFDEQTRQLLIEMARDISFGLEHLDRAAERDGLTRKLRESEEGYRLLFENSLDGIILTAFDGRILAANPEVCRMLGRSEDEIRQLGRTGIFDARDRRLALALAERDRCGRYSGELTMVRKGGEHFPVELTSAVFSDSSGEPRASMVIRDISERVSNRARIEEQLAELRRWNAALLGREERIIALKREINSLLQQSGQAPRYPSAAASSPAPES